MNVTTRPQIFNLSLLVFAIMLGPFNAAIAAEALPEPGPENTGLRLRLMVARHQHDTSEVFHVRVDLINVSDKTIHLQADWPNDFGKGDYRDYFESDLSIETYPEIVPAMVQEMVSERKLPQPEHSLKAGETLTVNWTASDRRLKKRVTSTLRNHNPRFPTDGLYSIHVSLAVRIAGGPASKVATAPSIVSGDGLGEPLPKAFNDSAAQGVILLRSNEQQIPIGGSQQLPKYPLGRLSYVNTNDLVGALDLGSRHKIEKGDQFIIHTGYIGQQWTLLIKSVRPSDNSGELKPFINSRPGRTSPDHHPEMLVRKALAELVLPEDPRHR